MADSRASKTRAINHKTTDAEPVLFSGREWHRGGAHPSAAFPGLEFALVAADVKSSHPFAISTGVP